MANMQTLSEMSSRYPLTDKGPMKADGTPGHNYTEVYERYMSPLRNTPIKLLEIGFGGGDSLKMWSDYFDDVEVYCMDNNLGRISEYGYTHKDNIKIFFGDQSDRESIINAYREMGSPQFDIIIDDGSHLSHHISLTFDALFEMLKPGGVYFVEDTPSGMSFSHPHAKNVHYDGELVVIEKESQV